MYKDFYASLKPLEGEIPYAEEERLAASGAPLLSWYRKNRRLLPWRENPEPYSVWISEIMLQQTRVEAVKPYFARFMEALPDITSLAPGGRRAAFEAVGGTWVLFQSPEPKKGSGLPDGRLRRSDACVAG